MPGSGPTLLRPSGVGDGRAGDDAGGPDAVAARLASLIVVAVLAASFSVFGSWPAQPTPAAFVCWAPLRSAGTCATSVKPAPAPAAMLGLRAADRAAGAGGRRRAGEGRPRRLRQRHEGQVAGQRVGQGGGVGRVGPAVLHRDRVREIGVGRGELGRQQRHPDVGRHGGPTSVDWVAMSFSSKGSDSGNRRRGDLCPVGQEVAARRRGIDVDGDRERRAGADGHRRDRAGHGARAAHAGRRAAHGRAAGLQRAEGRPDGAHGGEGHRDRVGRVGPADCGP